MSQRNGNATAQRLPRSHGFGDPKASTSKSSRNATVTKRATEGCIGRRTAKEADRAALQTSSPRRQAGNTLWREFPKIGDPNVVP